MADPTTANTSMFVPIRGTDVGTWDVPINANFNAIDSMFGGVTTLSPTNAPITLTSSQALNSIILLSGTLTGNVAITMANINKFWTVDNQLVNSPSSFVVTFVSTSGSVVIGAPPGMQDIYYDGVSVRYRGLAGVGTYWDYAGTTVPSWVTSCTKPPWLNCDGTTFSSATYPVLANLFGGNTLPDSKGRGRLTLDQGANRISSATLSSSTIGGSGGAQTVTLGTSNLPPYTPSGNVGISQNAAVNGGGSGTPGPFTAALNAPGAATITGSFSGNAQGGTSVPLNKMPPSYIGGITMIRAL